MVSGDNTPSNNTVSIASSMGSAVSSPRAGSGLIEFVRIGRNALGSLSVPRTVVGDPASLRPASKLAVAKYTPHAEDYPIETCDLTLIPAIPTGMYAQDSWSYMGEMSRILMGSVYANVPAVYNAFPANFWRRLCIGLASARCGIYWFLGSLPTARCRMTSDVMSLVSRKMIQNANGSLLSSANYWFVVGRSSTDRLSHVEMTAAVRVANSAPVLFRLASSSLVGQISRSAFSIEARSLRAQFRSGMTAWQYRMVGFDNDTIWEVLVANLLAGYPRAYLEDVMSLPYLENAIVHLTASTDSERDAAAEALSLSIATMTLSGYADRTAPLSPLTAEDLAPHTDDKSEAGDYEPDTVEQLSAMRGTGLGYDLQAVLPDRPGSLSGGADLPESGF